MFKNLNQKQLISRTASFFGDKPAFVYEGKSISFAQVNERANKAANALQKLGILNGDRVATLLGNCLEYPEIEFALIKGAFPQLVLSTRLKEEEIAFQINDAEATVIIFQNSFSNIIEEISEKIKTVKYFICIGPDEQRWLDYESLLLSASPTEPDTELNLDKLGELRYTSGTTGAPKGIMLPYKSRLMVIQNLLIDFIPDLTSEDKWLAVQPLYHGAGWFILPVWVKGITQYIIDKFDAQKVVSFVEKEKITAIKTIPTLLLRILGLDNLKSYNFDSVKTIIYGGSPMPIYKLKEAMGIFGNVFIQLYGQTEAPMTICVLRKEDHSNEKYLGSVGRPCTLVQVKIVDKEGEEVPVGEMGEVTVKGEHLMTGYLNRDEATAEALHNGWLRTGDLGKMDQNGYIYLGGGRKGDMIVSGGLNIYPDEVEQIIYRHPAVLEACVFGVPDEIWGEAVKAGVVLKKGQKVSPEQLKKHMQEFVDGYKIPKGIYFMKQLPKNAAGKIQRRELQKWYKKGDFTG